jgi:hypothetical protein
MNLIARITSPIAMSDHSPTTQPSPSLQPIICCKSTKKILQTPATNHPSGAALLERLNHFIKLTAGVPPNGCMFPFTPPPPRPLYREATNSSALVVDSDTNIALSPSYCDNIIGVLHIPPGADPLRSFGKTPSHHSWRFFAFPLLSPQPSNAFEIPISKIDEFYLVGSYEQPTPFAWGSGGLRTRTVQGGLGPLYRTRISVALGCKLHDIGAEFEVTYFEWGVRRDLEGDMYTAEDYRIADRAKEKGLQHNWEDPVGKNETWEPTTDEEIQRSAEELMARPKASEARKGEEARDMAPGVEMLRLTRMKALNLATEDGVEGNFEEGDDDPTMFEGDDDKKHP